MQADTPSKAPEKPSPPEVRSGRGWRFVPAALLLLLGVGAAAVPRVVEPGWRSAVSGWVGPLHAPERSEPSQLASLEPAALAARGADRLYRTFREGGYTLDGVRDGSDAVPRVLMTHLPDDLPTLGSVDTRKQVFIKMMLPLLLAENERVLEQRSRLIELRHRLETGAAASTDDTAWLAALAERYGAEDGDLDELVRRVDAVPPSLALAQAALETGWGTSRAAQRSRNMFGHMAPSGGGASARPFDNLAAAVEAYVLNLNSHRAYGGFREERAKMRAAGEVPDGFALAAELLRYSERKHDYVRDVRGLIRSNNLRPLDHARLDG